MVYLPILLAAVYACNVQRRKAGGVCVMVLEEHERREMDKIERMAREALEAAHMAQAAQSTHEAVCAERYKHLLEKLDESSRDIKDNSNLPWRYVTGAALLIGAAYTLYQLADRMILP